MGTADNHSAAKQGALQAYSPSSFATFAQLLQIGRLSTLTTHHWPEWGSTTSYKPGYLLLSDTNNGG